MTLQQLAEKLGGELHGDSNVNIRKLATLANAQVGDLSFLANPKYLPDMKNTKASCVMLTAEALADCPTNAIVLSNPYLAFATVASIFDKTPKGDQRIHHTAIIDPSSEIAQGVTIGAYAVVGKHCKIGANVEIGAGTVISDHVEIGENTMLKANLTIYHDVVIGKGCIIHSASVIGSDGFGNAKDAQGNWVKIPQLGRVVIGNNVEVGSSTTIDRGAIDDTVLADGVRIDNQVQIAHNVTIGKNTAIAGCTGIAGSVDIGENCLIAGQVGISGHLKICDNVIMMAAANTGKSITEPGIYAGGLAARPHMEWARLAARISGLDKLYSRVKALEKKVQE